MKVLGSGQDAEEQVWGRRLLACSLARARRRKCRTSYSGRMLGRGNCMIRTEKKGFIGDDSGRRLTCFSNRTRVALDPSRPGWTHRPLLYS